MIVVVVYFYYFIQNFKLFYFKKRGSGTACETVNGIIRITESNINYAFVIETFFFYWENIITENSIKKSI